MKKKLQKKHRSKKPIKPYPVKKQRLDKHDSKSPNDLYSAEKKLVDLLKHKFADN